MAHYGLSAHDLAERLRIQKSAVSHLLSGRNKPRFDILQRFATAFPELNIRWLLTGEGEMMLSPTPPEPSLFPPADDIQAGPEEPEETPVPHESQSGKAPDQEKTITHEANHSQESGIRDLPHQIIRIYPDGTFDILHKRNG